MGERPQSPPAAAPAPAFRQPQVAREKAAEARDAAGVSPAAAARSSALATIPAAVGKLAVDDLAEGSRRLGEIAERLQARELARRIEGDGLVVELIVPATAYADLERELSGIGRWTVLTPPAAAGEPVRLQIRLGH